MSLPSSSRSGLGKVTAASAGPNPKALRRGARIAWWAKSIFGDGRRYSVLAARTKGGRVSSFKLQIGAAGE